MIVYRAVLLCSRIGYLEGRVWDVTGPPFFSAGEAARWCVHILGVGGCVGWDVVPEVRR